MILFAFLGCLGTYSYVFLGLWFIASARYAFICCRKIIETCFGCISRPHIHVRIYSVYTYIVLVYKIEERLIAFRV